MGAEEDEVEMDMMPMIDVVFQLIVFFLLVMDFSSQELEPVTLPQAETAQEPEENRDNVTLINIAHDRDLAAQCENFSMDPRTEEHGRICSDIDHWLFFIRGERFENIDELRPTLKNEAEQAGRDEEGISELNLIIRADRRAPWVFIDDILMEASAQDIQIQNVEMTAEMPQPAN